MFFEDPNEIIVPDVSQGTIDRISWTADGSILSISDTNGSLFSYTMRCAQSQSNPSSGLMRIASGPAAAFMRLISEPISFQRVFSALIVAGIAVLYLTAHVMDAKPMAFMHAVFGVSEGFELIGRFCLNSQFMVNKISWTCF